MRNISRLAVFAFIAVTLGQTPARADVIQLTTILPPAAGAYSLPSFICIAPVCFADISVFGFENTSDVFSAGNELVNTNAIFAADVFQNNAGSPGAPLGPLSVPGTMDFTYFGRTASSQLGTFNAQITDFDFAGMFNGHLFDIKQNPILASTGQTTISPFVGNQFLVSSFFDVFAELSIDGGPFIPGPVRDFTVTPTVPEPASVELLLFGLVGLAGVARRMRAQRGH